MRIEWIQRLIDLLPWRRKPSEPQPPPVEEIKPPTPGPTPEPPPTPEPIHPPVVEQPLMQWFDRNGSGVLRVRADLHPKGYSIITAHGHRSIDPALPHDHEAWVAANNSRPPHRFVDGWAEWTLPHSITEYATRALSQGMGSGSIIMVFCKRDPSGDISWFLRAERPHGTVGATAPTRNITNQEWRQVR